MANLCLVKMKNGSFAPAFDDDHEKAKKFKTGEIYASEIWKKRNIRFHKKFFALVNMVFDMQEHHKTVEDMRVEIQLKCGAYKEHLTEKGKIIYVPKSISFKKMDDVEFEELYNKSIDVCIRDYANGCTREEIDCKVDMILSFA